MHVLNINLSSQSGARTILFAAAHVASKSGLKALINALLQLPNHTLTGQITRKLVEPKPAQLKQLQHSKKQSIEDV